MLKPTRAGNTQEEKKKKDLAERVRTNVNHLSQAKKGTVDLVC